MEQVLQLQNPHWEKGLYDDLMYRDVFAELKSQLSMSEIMVLQGIRRCGKSTLFKLLINELMQTTEPKRILYVNLDDPYFTDLYQDPKNFYKIKQAAEKLVGSEFEYLFLDEVQNIIMWEKFVKSMYDSNIYKKIFVTGSNSSLLSGRYATLLTGRYIKHHIYPLSYNEILTSKNIFPWASKKWKAMAWIKPLSAIKHFLLPFICFCKECE